MGEGKAPSAEAVRPQAIRVRACASARRVDPRGRQLCCVGAVAPAGQQGGARSASGGARVGWDHNRPLPPICAFPEPEGTAQYPEPAGSAAGPGEDPARGEARDLDPLTTAPRTWALRSRPPVEPPKMGEGVSGFSVGAEKLEGLASVAAPSFARTTTARTRRAGCATMRVLLLLRTATRLALLASAIAAGLGAAAAAAVAAACENLLDDCTEWRGTPYKEKGRAPIGFSSKCRGLPLAACRIKKDRSVEGIWLGARHGPLAAQVRVPGDGSPRFDQRLPRPNTHLCLLPPTTRSRDPPVKAQDAAGGGAPLSPRPLPPPATSGCARRQAWRGSPGGGARGLERGPAKSSVGSAVQPGRARHGLRAAGRSDRGAGPALRPSTRGQPTANARLTARQSQPRGSALLRWKQENALTKDGPHGPRFRSATHGQPSASATRAALAWPRGS